MAVKLIMVASIWDSFTTEPYGIETTVISATDNELDIMEACHRRICEIGGDELIDWTLLNGNFITANDRQSGAIVGIYQTTGSFTISSENINWRVIQ